MKHVFEPRSQALSPFSPYKGGKEKRVFKSGVIVSCLQTVQCDIQQSEELIEQALRRWDADKLGIPDYALESSG